MTSTRQVNGELKMSRVPRSPCKAGPTDHGRFGLIGARSGSGNGRMLGISL